MEKQLTSEELERFNAARKNYYELRSHLADIAITEERLKLDKQTTLTNIEIAQNEVGVLQKEFYDKYGEGRIDTESGMIITQ